MTDNDQAEYIYKVLLLGDSSVGKTCFLKRFVDGTFQEVYMSTIGLDYRLKVMTLQDNTKVKLQIWDTAGQEKYRAVTKSYIKGSRGVLLIYDISRKETFENIDNWYRDIKETGDEECIIELIGNKSDLEESRQVPKIDGESIANKFNVSFFEASALKDNNVTETFIEIAEQMNKNKPKIINK